LPFVVTDYPGASMIFNFSAARIPEKVFEKE